MGMPVPVYARRRAQAARAFINILKSSCENVYGQPDIVGYGLDVVIGAAVFIGQAEGRPMTATDIAAYTGIPRPTVLRRLSRYARKGTVVITRKGNRQVVWRTDVNDPVLVEKSLALINRAVRDYDSLSRMDTNP